MKRTIFSILALLVISNCVSFPESIHNTDDPKKIGMTYLKDVNGYYIGTERKELLCDIKENGDLECKNLKPAYKNPAGSL